MPSKKLKNKKHGHSHGHGHHHHSKHKSKPESENEEAGQEFVSRISAEDMEKLKSELTNVCVPMLLEDDSHERTWKFHSGKSLEKTGMLYCTSFPSSGTAWKINFILECTAEVMYDSVVNKKEAHWVPYTAYSKVVCQQGDLLIFQTRSSGVTAVNDRDFVYARKAGVCKKSQKPDELEKTVYYAAVRSIPDIYCKLDPDCVRGEHLPSGTAWTMMADEKGQPRCYATLIYNSLLNGLLPKSLADLAVSSFLTKQVKAAQEHARELTKRQMNGNGHA